MKEGRIKGTAGTALRVPPEVGHKDRPPVPRKARPPVPSLTAEDISYTYKGQSAPVLTGISATFPQGQITAVTGKNGSGKTTFAKLLTGILKPTTGTIKIDGKSIEKMTLTDIGRQIGFVMQDPSRQLFTTSVKEEIDYGLKNLGLPPEEIESTRNEYLTYFGLERYEDRFPFALSTGEKQRLILAAILAMKPSYLILDEPTSALDKERRQALGTYLTEITKGTAGTALRVPPKVGHKDRPTVPGIILISHDEKFIEKYADARIDIESGGYK
jgi:energy-coupling factor transport system ATP-binding protein